MALASYVMETLAVELHSGERLRWRRIESDGRSFWQHQSPDGGWAEVASVSIRPNISQGEAWAKSSPTAVA